ncbi:MAG: hypothetical protein RRC07_12590 [Anaerolineae bacterium]|nr:hypothetical protein [Anaerolineae bacterium]
MRRRYPERDSFDHPLFVADEIAAKRELVARAQELLSAAALGELLAGWRYDELVQRLETLGKATHLLWNRVPQRGDLAILYQRGLDRAEFAIQFQRPLYGSAGAAQRLECFSNYARRPYLPDRWPFPTFFLFVTQPDSELFVQPQVARWFLQYLGLASVYTASPSAEVYSLLRRQAELLADALQRYRPRDMGRRAELPVDLRARELGAGGEPGRRRTGRAGSGYDTGRGGGGRASSGG